MEEYTAFVSELASKRRFGNLPGIKISELLLAAVGNPQDSLQCIHIAGTNGKGSTVAFLREIAYLAGIKTGVFTSPHLTDFRERIMVDKQMISKEDVVKIGQKLCALPLFVSPTMFDYSFGIAMEYFKAQNCELVIIETGLGGRLDSTNVITHPLISVITKIGYDHMDVLGTTLAEIASEKAGIIKEKTPVVIGKQDQEAMLVLQEKAKAFDCEVITCEDQDNLFIRQFLGEEIEQMNMLGEYQLENATNAYLCANKLRTLGFNLNEETIREGILKATWPGRMEILSNDPFLLIDGAHNLDGVKGLVQALSSLYKGEAFHFVIGVLADKDYEQMCQQILPLCQYVTTVTVEHQRGLSKEVLKAYFSSCGIKADSCNNIEECFDKIRKENKDSVKTIIFGSLYFIGEVREKFFMD